jgi:hypothetical protein
MESALRWLGIYLLNLLAATLGVLLTTGIFLNVVLKPVEPLIGHSKLFSVAKGPYYPLPLLLALVAGYVRNVRFKGNHGFWVWVLPALYLAVKIMLWRNPSVLASNSWGATISHFFAGEPPYYPEQDVMVPVYTSVSYSVGALLGSVGFLRGGHHGEASSGASDQRG